jgi:hypothetical protein
MVRDAGGGERIADADPAMATWAARMDEIGQFLST